MELIASCMNWKIDAIQNSNLFKTYITSRHSEKFTAHLIRYSDMIWKFYKITYISAKLGCDKEDLQGFIAAQFLHKSFDYIWLQTKCNHFLYGSKEPGYSAKIFSLHFNIAHKPSAEMSSLLNSGRSNKPICSRLQPRSHNHFQRPKALSTPSATIGITSNYNLLHQIGHSECS